MASKKTLSRLHTLIWVLVYGGLLTLVLGLATRRTEDGLGLGLIIAGSVLAVVGFALIVVRSRLQPTEPS